MGTGRDDDEAERPMSSANISSVLQAIDMLTAAGNDVMRSSITESAGVAVRVANTAAGYLQAWRLVHRAYTAKGYGEAQPDGLWYDLFQALPKTTVYLAQVANGALGTATLVVDSGFGLPADSLYEAELDGLRAQGRRMAEIGSLAHVGGGSSLACTLALFRHAYLTAAHLERCDSLVITVNPRHVAFYESRLLFRVIGSERSFAKVGGAPAVLLHLDLRTANTGYRERHGPDAKALWHFFFDPDRIAKPVRRIWRERRPLDALVVRHLFAELRPLLQSATPEQRELLRAGHPELAEWLHDLPVPAPL
jgi:hypothetical protein